MKKDIESIKKIIEQSNIDDTNKKEIIDLLNKNKFDKAIMILLRIIDIGAHILDLIE